MGEVGGKTWRANRSTPAGVVRSPTPIAIDARGQQQDVAALEVLLLHPWILRVPAKRGWWV